MELGLGLQVEETCTCGLCDTAGHPAHSGSAFGKSTNVPHRDQLKVTGWKRKREKNLPSSPGNAKQDPAEPNPLFSQPWVSIYRAAKARPTLTSKVAATRGNLHGSCSAQAVVVTLLVTVPVPDECSLMASAWQQRPAQHTLTRCPVTSNTGACKYIARKAS